MGRTDNGFNLDDMMEIFGDAAPAPAARAIAPASQPVSAPAPAGVPAPASAPAPAAPASGEDLTADEQALLMAYERRKQEQRFQEEARRKQEQKDALEREERRIIEEFERGRAAQAPPPLERPLLDIEAAENEAFCSMLDETRAVMLAFLVPLIGIKATGNMLNKSVEKARAKAPVVLKDANWQMDGTLREDGSVDLERLLKNVASLPPATRVDDYMAGLRELVGLRIRAVEAGLGAGVCADMKAKLLATRGGEGQKGIPTAWVDAFYSRVLA